MVSADNFKKHFMNFFIEFEMSWTFYKKSILVWGYHDRCQWYR